MDIVFSDGKGDFVRNPIVKMDWRRDCYFELKADLDFVGCCQQYVANGQSAWVMFRGGKAFRVLNDEGDGFLDNVGFAQKLKELIDSEGNNDFDIAGCLEDHYIEIYNGVCMVDDDNPFGFSDEDLADIEARADDISQFYVSEETVGGVD